jgi:glycine cleavage system H protein
MSTLKYTKDHEVLKVEGDIAWIGITEYAQDALGDLVFIELPEVGRQVSKGDYFAVVESVKAASEIYTPVAGEIVEVNTALESDYDKIKQPIEAGWVIKIKITDTAVLNELMDQEAYDAYLKQVA